MAKLAVRVGPTSVVYRVVVQQLVNEYATGSGLFPAREEVNVMAWFVAFPFARWEVHVEL